MPDTAANSILLEIQDAVRQPGSQPVMPVAGNTKPGLSTVDEAEISQLSVAGLTGIVTYDPSEFLITARAGTTIEELNAALEAHGQYLPFDPMFVDEGATVGGTIASGISGPRCMLYGGLRDFVMEVELVDGLGELCRGGGKVVKNAAGFDLPKLMCGSYGRLGILTEATLKVLPRSAATRALETRLDSWQEVVRCVQTLRGQPLPISCLDISPSKEIRLEISGPTASLEKVIDRIRQLVPAAWQTPPSGTSRSGQAETRSPSFSETATTPATSCEASSNRYLIRVAMDLEQVCLIAEAADRIEAGRLLGFQVGGSLAWLDCSTLDEIVALDESLTAIGCAGVVVRGPMKALQLIGKRDWLVPARRIQAAIDPHARFVPFPSMPAG